MGKYCYIASMRLLGGMRGTGVPTGEEEGWGHIVSSRAQLVWFGQSK